MALSLLAALFLTGCGGKGSDGGGGSVDVGAGRKLFKQNCGTCHALADAKTNGAVGPNLDELAPDEQRVRAQIDSGGGVMPADIVKGKDADTVAAYVAKVAGK